MDRLSDCANGAVSGSLRKLIRDPSLSFVQVAEERRGNGMDLTKASFEVPLTRISPMLSRQAHENRDEEATCEDEAAFLIIAAGGNLNWL